MAVTLTADNLLDPLRLADTAESDAIAERLLNVCKPLVELRAPDAPEAIQNEAVLRLAGYMHDSPSAPSGASWANQMRNSGAGALLRPYTNVRARSADE